MSAINNTDHIYNEITYNLDILEHSLKEGKSIDIGFIEIFANDAEELKKADFDQKKFTKLSDRLNEVATRIYDTVGASALKSVNPDDLRPLVGELKSTLEKFSSDLVMQPIAQDGHCLFRSVAAFVIDQIKKNPWEEQKKIYSHIAAQVEDLKSEDSELEPLYKEVLTLVSQVAEEKVTIKEALNNRKSSDLLVQFLRHLACAYNKKHGNEVFQTAATLEGTKEDYLANMCDMQKATYGDAPELHALSQTLNLDLRVIDLTQLGKGTITLDSHFVDQKPNTCYLLLQPGHYDMAFRRQ